MKTISERIRDWGQVLAGDDPQRRESAALSMLLYVETNTGWRRKGSELAREVAEGYDTVSQMLCEAVDQGRVSSPTVMRWVTGQRQARGEVERIFREAMAIPASDIKISLARE